SMDTHATGPLFLPSSGLFLSRTIRGLSLASSYRSIAAGSEARIWPADAGTSHRPAPSAGFSGGASWSEHPQPACGWILSAFGFPGIDSRRFGGGGMYLYGKEFATIMTQKLA